MATRVYIPIAKGSKEVNREAVAKFPKLGDLEIHGEAIVEDASVVENLKKLGLNLAFEEVSKAHAPAPVAHDEPKKCRKGE